MWNYDYFKPLSQKPGMSVGFVLILEHAESIHWCPLFQIHPGTQQTTFNLVKLSEWILGEEKGACSF